MLGAQYALLQEEFFREPNRPIRKVVQRVLVSVGGTDRFELTRRLVEWTRTALRGVSIDILAAPFFGEHDTRQLQRTAGTEGNIILHRDSTKIRDLMLSCDVAVSGGGQTAYELAATGTPSLSIRIADNQTCSLEGLSAKGTLLWIGDVRDDDLGEKFLRALTQVSDAGLRESMSVSGRLLVDGYGAQRVANTMLEVCNR